MKILDSKAECDRCKKPITGEFCGRCLTDFRNRTDPALMSQQEKRDDLVAWKMAAIPQILQRRRASELSGMGIRPSQLRGTKSFRLLANIIKHRLTN